MLHTTATRVAGASSAQALSTALEETATPTDKGMPAADVLANELHAWRTRHVALSVETDALLARCADTEDEAIQLQEQLARYECACIPGCIGACGRGRVTRQCAG